MTTRDPYAQVRLLIAEEQQLLLEAYQTFLLPFQAVEVAGSIPTTASEPLSRAAAAIQPDVVIFGTRRLTPASVETLAELQHQMPDVGVILLCVSLEPQSSEPLREFCRRRTAGFGLVIKPTLETIEQLLQVIQTVYEGRMIIDPSVMGELVTLDRSPEGNLSVLSPREFEVLGFMAKGFHNAAIAASLFVERATIERYIHNIYGKLGNRPAALQPRAHAISLYARALEAVAN
jgi:DNA-binding NarL/FixJ family response regulator